MHRLLIYPVYKALAVVVALALAPLAGIHNGHTWFKARAEQAYARTYSHASASGMRCLVALWNRESGWSPWAVNPYSGAYGIPQALGHGRVYQLGHPRDQIRWGVKYIRTRYGTFCTAWEHEVIHGWY